MNGREKRQKLKFQLYESGCKAAQLILNASGNTYTCPICMDAIGDISQLTLEHVPQKNVGGRILCLTCRDCNSRAGHDFEAMMPYEQQGKVGIGRIPTRGSFGDEKMGSMLNGTWAIDESGMWSFVCIAKMNDPNKLQEAERSRKEFKKGMTLQASWSIKYCQRKVDIGHLKNAYLAAFVRFGYGLIREESFRIVRQQIRYPNVEVIPKFHLYSIDKHISGKAIFIASRPIRTMICRWGKDAVFLPDAKDTKGDIYKWIDLYHGIEGALKFNIERGYDWPMKRELQKRVVR